MQMLHSPPQAAARYGAIQRASASPRELEVQALTQIAQQLDSAADMPARVAALHRNLRLWTILESDLLHQDNALPPAVKAPLLSLAAFARRASLAAMSDLRPLDALAALNRDLAEGLATRPAPAAARGGAA